MKREAENAEIMKPVVLYRSDNNQWWIIEQRMGTIPKPITEGAMSVLTE